MDKIELENIVYVSDSDYTQLCCELDQDYNPEDIYAAWIDQDKLFQYLLQWWYPGEHDTNIYNAEDINTEFLGYEYKYQDMIFLLNHNTKIGYAGLSRIVKFLDE